MPPFPLLLPLSLSRPDARLRRPDSEAVVRTYIRKKKKRKEKKPSPGLNTQGCRRDSLVWGTVRDTHTHTPPYMYVYVYINGVIDAGKSDGKKDGKEDLRQAGKVMLKTQKVMFEKRRVGINSGWRTMVGEW